MVEKEQQWLRDSALKVLDSVVDAIITIDDHGLIQSVNQATEKLFGYDASELIGQSLTMLMPEPYRSHHQAYVDHFLHSVDLQFDLQADLPLVYCDPVQIQQVALNLSRNAMNAMLEVDCACGNKIMVRTRVHGDDIEVAVKDLGTGVADSDQSMVFSPFHTTKADGMGMGPSYLPVDHA